MIPEHPHSLTAMAEAAPLTRAAIAGLAGSAPAEQLTAALARAVEDRKTRPATALALAIAVAGAKVPPELALRLIPDVDSMDFVLMIAGAMEGDRLEALTQLAAGGLLSWEREALVLFLAVRLLDGAEPPLKLVARLRRLLRESLSEPAAIVAGMAASLVDDPDVRALAGDTMVLAELGRTTGLDQRLWKAFTAPVLDSLPEEEGGHFTPGYTVVRSAPKVGRNDPCPCGSGRKYKKCCAGKEQAAPVPRSAVEQFLELGPRHTRAKQLLFDRMRPSDLEQLDPQQLPTLQAIAGLRRLARYERWQAAERYVDAIAARTDLPGDDPGGYRIELAEQAIRARQLELAERQMALGNPKADERKLFDARLALARNEPDALSRLDSVILDGHARDPTILFDCAYILLEHSPALGILAARGAMSKDRLLDSDAILDEIGRARDILGLPSRDPWTDVLESFLEGSSSRPAAEGGDEDRERHETQVAGVRAELRAARDRARRLDEEVAKREHQLEGLSREREKLAAMVEAQQGREDRERIAALEADRQRLRMKIEKLKGEVTEGVEERAALRRELARRADQPSRQPPAEGRREVPEEIESDAEGDAVASRPRHILVPELSNAASRALTTVPARIAADALLETARLAGGDDHAWSGAKHMRRAHEILSSRIGRTWRLLFTASEDRLHILDLVHRRDLDNAIARLSRG